MSAAVAVLDGSVPCGALVLGKPGTVTGADRAVLNETASCLALLTRGEHLRAELHRRLARTRTLSDELRESRQRLATVRDLERRRLVSAIVTGTTRQLTGCVTNCVS